MSNFLYFRQTTRPFPERYFFEIAGDGYQVLGAEVWRDLITLLMEYLAASPDGRASIDTYITDWFQRPHLLAGRNDNYPAFPNRTTEEKILLLLLLELQSIPRARPDHRCPRIFISHRQPDTLYALRMARLALDHDFAFWLDILDPNLLALGTTPPANPSLLPLLTACIIEMALLNCTHVLACLTPNSAGSAWTPYEYGRIKDHQLVTINSAAWLHPGFHPTALPEYLLLGELTQNEAEIRSWLTAEYVRCGGSSCRPQPEPQLDNIPQLP